MNKNCIFATQDVAMIIEAALSPRSRLKIPHGEPLEILTSWLNRIADWAVESDTGEPPMIRILSDPSFQKDARALRSGLERWQSAIAAYTAPFGNIDEVREPLSALTAIKALSEAIDTAMPYLQPAPAWESPPEGWHRIAYTTARFFVSCMARVNPGAKFGFTNDGPVAKFVAGVIKYIFCLTIPSGTVAKYLKRNENPLRTAALPEEPGGPYLRYVGRHKKRSSADCQCILCLLAKRYPTIDWDDR